MSKKVINQNTNYDTELLNSIESDFIFDNNPINRLENTAENIEKDNGSEKIDKQQQLNDLKLQRDDADKKNNTTSEDPTYSKARNRFCIIAK